MLQSENDVVFVTGGGRGFGRAIALSFAKRGAAVTIMARSRDELDETARLGASMPGRILAITGDVTQADDVARAVEATREAFGPISVLIHNAGVWSAFGPLWLVDSEKWWWEQQVHVLGSLNLIKAAVPEMVERGSGRVILVASKGANSVIPNGSGYAISKASQVQLVAHLAAEGAGKGIRAFAIHPGGFVSQLVRDVGDSTEARQWLPWFTDRVLADTTTEVEQAAILERCGQLCLSLASGRYDSLSGRYLTPDDDLDELIASGKERSGIEG
jgi:NAD(P)-dependent dehydrogenase (short-subunit alcohol dehydrogenase family)